MRNMSKKLKKEIIDYIFLNKRADSFKSDMVSQCFDISDEIIIAIDLEGKITHINKKGRQLLGYKKAEVTGKNFINKFLLKTDQKLTKDFIEQLIINKASSEKIKSTLRTKNNERIITEARIETISTKHQNIIGLLFIGKDITGYLESRKDIQLDLNLYRILANNIPNINLYLFNRDLLFILAEGNEMKNIELSYKDFEGKKLEEITNNKLKEVWNTLFKKAIKGEKLSQTYKIDNYYYHVSVIPIKDSGNEINYGMAITQNITEFKVIENRLKKLKDEADKANRAKSDFIARISHDIRTPLNAISGFTEQLFKTDLSGQQEDYLHIIDKSSEHLLSLINDLLVYSAIEAPRIRFFEIPFKLENPLSYVYTSLLNKAEEKELKLTYKIDERLNCVIIGDSGRLRQILMNMLNNAIKFTNEGSIEIVCSPENETKDEIFIKFEISDTGIGIKPDKLKTIFDQFKQADASFTQLYGGTGLGLTICKTLIEKQNGRLEVLSQIGKGSKFTFVIPYKKGKESDIVNKEISIDIDKKLENKKALVVEDDSVNRLLVKTMLENFNCKIDIADNGRSAIELLDKNKYDIILLDIHMPEISGFDVAKFLRNEKKDESTKIIAITAVALKEDIKNFKKAGIDDLLIKPFKETELYNKIGEVLRLTKHSHALTIKEIILKEDLSPETYSLEELRKIANGEEKFIKKMLATFIENSENTVFLLEQLLEEKKWKQIGETAHKILPSYRHLKVESVIPLLVELHHNTLIKPNHRSVPELLKKTTTKIKKVIKELKREIN